MKTTPILRQEETDGDVLAEQAYKEMDDAASGKEPEPKPTEPPKKEPGQEGSEPTKPKEENQSEEEAAQQKAEQEAEEAENTKLLEAKDEDLDEGQKTKKSKLVKAKADAEAAAAAQKPEEEIIREHALKHNLTMDEAKDDIDKTKSIVEKYKKDPVELARALRNTQSAYDQLKAKEGKPQVVVKQDSTAEIKAFAEKNREKIIKSYREKFPKKYENAEDDVIIEDAVAQAERDYDAWQKEESAKITTNAATKREQLLTSIPEADKRFIPDVKALLSRTPDHEVVHESFDIKDLVLYARGSYYTPERIKAIEDAAVKRGKEDPKIVGAKGAVGGGGPTGKKPASSTAWAGTEDQKSRALEMFSTEDGYSDEQAYAAFQDTYKEELKKDKKFV